MKTEQQAKTTEKIVAFIFYSMPFILTAVFFLFAKSPYYLNFKHRDIEGTLSSAWIGYSFAAAFFLIALPRNKYLKKLESKGLLVRYAFIIMTPAITGTLHMLSIILTDEKSMKILLNISAFLFYSTVFYALYSVCILTRILFINFHSK